MSRASSSRTGSDLVRASVGLKSKCSSTKDPVLSSERLLEDWKGNSRQRLERANLPLVLSTPNPSSILPPPTTPQLFTPQLKQQLIWRPRRANTRA